MGWDWYDDSVPWRAFTPPFEKMETEPTLVIGEFMFISLAIFCFFHAFVHDRQHLFIWFGSLISGTANDLFFMFLPFVDNFFHAQSCFMITPRLPLYIPCCYVSFIYISVVGGWRWGWGKKRPPKRGCEGEGMGNRVERSVVSGLGSGIFYCLFDLVGGKFLWWTWHDTDAAIETRWLGVPLGSTLWTIVHVFTFSLLVHFFILSRPSPPSSSSSPSPSLSWVRFFGGILGVAVLNTPLMMIILGPFQLHQLKFSFSPSFHVIQLPGKPDFYSLLMVLFLSASFLIYRKIQRVKTYEKARYSSSLPYTCFSPISSWDHYLLYAVYAYIFCLLTIMCLFDPGAVVAEGIHQPIGSCYVQDYDLSHYPRFKYLCPSDFNEDFDFHCLSSPPSLSSSFSSSSLSWFTICGKEYRDFMLFFGVGGGLGGVCVGFYTYLLKKKAFAWEKYL